MNARVKEKVRSVITEIADERSLTLPELKDDSEIVDELGFSSMAVAALIARLEEALEVDPFEDENVMITDIRTVGDLCGVYERALGQNA
jgi:acyl carrier protein